MKPEAPGSFPQVRSFRGEFRFGWSNIPAATARAQIVSGDKTVRVSVKGGTTGMARLLWRIDAR